MGILDGVILDDIKKLLGLDKDYDVFDMDAIIGINSVFATLQQLGVGPKKAFQILDGTETWSEFFALVYNPENYASVKSLMFMRVRLMFDPPSTSYALDSYKEQIKELEWRLNVQSEDAFGGEDPSPSDATWWVSEDGEIPLESQVGDLTIDPETGNVWKDI